VFAVLWGKCSCALFSPMTLTKRGLSLLLPGSALLLNVARMGQARKTFIQTTCPDCGLELRLTDDARGFKIVYDLRDWRRICTRAHLGDAAWCLIATPSANGRERNGDLHVDC
jgi:hypothetical protein